MTAAYSEPTESLASAMAGHHEPAGEQRPAVVGLDLSLAATGVARPGGLLDTIKPSAEGDARLVEIVDSISVEVMTIAGVLGLVVLEDLPFGHNHAAGRLGMLHGAVRVAFRRHDVRYITVPPATLKVFATGRGNATKADLRMALYRRLDVDERDDNRVDAAWLRLLGLQVLGHPEVQLPKDHLRSLAKLDLSVVDAVMDGAA